MRLFLRVLGTWMLGLAVIFAVIDGTKSLAANALVLTPLVDTWTALHTPSLDGLRTFFATRFFSPLLGPVFESLLTAPTFSVIGVPAIIFILLGRSRYSRRYVRQDQI